ncbi:MAG: ATP-binding cassette domain-containing protein [Candidatus Eiseniibacteriota bacterium]
MGANGAGKTTLLRIIAGQLDPLAAQLALLQIPGEGGRVLGELRLVQLHDFGGDPVQKHAVVGHDHQAAVKSLQIVLEPLERGQIQVVGGLVQK